MDSHQNKPWQQLFHGSIGGITNTIVFNPYDRAMYLSVKNKTKFFIKPNWNRPYHGLSEALFHRTLSYGLYFPFIDMFDKYIDNKIVSGVCAGMTTSIMTSPFASIKLYNWNTHNTKTSLVKLSQVLYSKYGTYAFTRGVGICLKRDIVFSIVFGSLSFNFNQEKHFWLDVLCMSAATISSSPLNYWKNRIYQNTTSRKIRFVDVINELKKDILLNKTLKGKPTVLFVLHDKFSVGWGTLRVGLGMSLSRQIYIWLSKAV